MTSSRPYMVRAIYDWVLDNDCTPYLLVNALYEGVEVPQQYVDDGKIVLNIAPQAVAGLQIENDMLSFSGRFSGVARDVFVPMSAVLGIYARENGQGMLFDAEEPSPPPEPAPESPDAGRPAKRPSLKVVK